MVGPELSAVDKLLAEEALVPDVKEAEDMILGPLATMPYVGYRQPKPTKPVDKAKVEQEVGHFCPKILENQMLCDVGRVFICQIADPYRFAQGGEASFSCQRYFHHHARMSHSARRLSPPLEIAY